MLKTHLQYQNRSKDQGSELFFAGQSLHKIIDNYSGPTFVYSLDLMQNRFSAMKNLWPELNIHYAMKANSNRKILSSLKSFGSRVDVVSGGELKQALESGMQARDIIFSGVAKTKAEIELAIQNQIHQINVESLPELLRIIQLATGLKKKISVVLRVNPDIEIQTHKYIATGLIENKFGIEFERLSEITKILESTEWVCLAGLSLHLGSQMLEFSGLAEALKKTKKVFLQLQAQFPTCQRFDFGGGLGVDYHNVDMASETENLKKYFQTVKAEIGDLKNVEFQSEPGRWLVAHAGILVCQVQYIKETANKNFVIVDSGMNHLLRPSLYEAYHWVGPWSIDSEEKMAADVVGPICESSDFFAKNRSLPLLKQDDFLIIADCGAYGAAMSSTYNLHGLAKEVFID